MTVIYHCLCLQSSSQEVEVHGIDFVLVLLLRNPTQGGAVLLVILCYRNWENACLVQVQKMQI